MLRGSMADKKKFINAAAKREFSKLRKLPNGKEYVTNKNNASGLFTGEKAKLKYTGFTAQHQFLHLLN